MVYTDKQIQRYLKRIEFPGDVIQANYSSLEKLMRSHLEAIPYGNLSLFYYGNSSSRGCSLNNKDLFKKIVIDKREGHCFEQNSFFLGILKSLGFVCYGVSAMVAYGRKASENRHFVLVVLCEGAKYLVDVGYGRMASLCPVPLDSSEVTCFAGVKFRIVSSHLDGVLDETSNYPPFFLLQALLPNTSSGKPMDLQWKPQIYFTLAPFSERDALYLCSAIENDPTSYYTRHMILRARTKAEPGQVSFLDNTLQFMSDSGHSWSIKIHTEKERRDAYLFYFNIRIPSNVKEHFFFFGKESPLHPQPKL